MSRWKESPVLEKALTVSNWKSEVQTTMTYQQFPAFLERIFVFVLVYSSSRAFFGCPWRMKVESDSEGCRNVCPEETLSMPHMESDYGRQEDLPETCFEVWRVTNVLNEIDEHRKWVFSEDTKDIVQ